MTQATPRPQDNHALDALTGGAFTAPTAGERAARVRDWLASDPSPEQMSEVYRELSARDKGAARPLREKLDEIKRSKNQALIGAEWAARAEALLALPRLNIADALAWQRDAAKAGAPLSREPLSALKAQLAERVRGIEDLQHRVQVQREAAVLLAQRIEVLSTKPWRDGLQAVEALRSDVPQWQADALALEADANWPSVDPRFPPQIEASRQQLQAVWDAFQAALAQAVAASENPEAPLPPVPVWADELRAARGLPVEAAAPRAARPKVDPQQRAQAQAAVRGVLTHLEQELAQGHGKGSAGAAGALRQALKDHGRWIDDKLEAQVHAALAAAGELEGWQRWRADQLREELVAKAESLITRGADGAASARLGGRKMQETLRNLREQWKQTDQGGVPNHALWKRFDEACNEAHKVVEAWLARAKAEAAQNKAHRLALIDEVNAWAAAQAGGAVADWKAFNRAIHQFSERWREAGHLSEKAFAELQPQWKAAIHAAAAPLEAAQAASVARRQALIEEARVLGAAPQLRVDAVRALQQRWQAEAQAVPLDRKHEQKLWDQFRKPIDEAFSRKDEVREKAAAEMGERDRAVFEAARALEAATASGDAQQIRAAMAALDAALHAQAAASASAPSQASTPAPANAAAQPAAAAEPEAGAADASGTEPAGAAPTPAAKPARPVVAMRGDDRPGMRKAEPAPVARGGRPGDRRGPGGPRDGRDGREGRDGRGPGAGRFDDARQREPRGPRLGDAAFRAQRDAVEHAQAALRKLAAQAHGEALSQLLTAWEQRDPQQLPAAAQLGRAVPAATRSAWVQALGAAPQPGDAQQALLRLEMAAEVPTPAEHLDARRALQLQMLTRRNDPPPSQTWGQDVARVLSGAHAAPAARRLQSALRALLRQG